MDESCADAPIIVAPLPHQAFIFAHRSRLPMKTRGGLTIRMPMLQLRMPGYCRDRLHVRRS
jgi:hypothetical protein